MLTLEQVKAANSGSKLLSIKYTKPDDTVVELIATVPSSKLFDKFQSELLNETKREHSLKNLVRACVKSLDPIELQSFLDEFPGAVGSISTPLLKAAGMGKEAEFIFLD